jgi:hypothetical protein
LRGVLRFCFNIIGINILNLILQGEGETPYPCWVDVRSFFPNITSLEQNSTSHETLMLSSEMILKVTFAINSVSTSFTLIEN